MPRRLRHIPHENSLVEITCRTIGERYLLKPTRELQSIIIGVLGRAQREHPVLIHAFTFMSNHYHMLLTPGSALQMSRFVGYVNGNIAREVGRLIGWNQKFWARRYQAIVISDEEEAQIERLRYLLSHGCKEGLVASPRDWPGANSVQTLLDGTDVEGLWFDRTQEYKARQRGEKYHRLAYAEVERVKHSPLRLWAHLPPERHQKHIGDMVADIEAEHARIHKKNNTEPAGIAYVLSLHHEDRPKEPKHAPAPAFHAYAKKVRKAMENAYRIFYNAFRAAADALKEGTLDAPFPDGCFPPGRPFVGPVPEMAPG
jgi:REP element-mobilizing transposase RayT